MYIDNIH